jgi:hypothetical protein
LAGRGDGVDAPPDAGDRAALRAKALAWLRADLSARRAADRLSGWLTDPDLAGVRPGLARIGLSAAERAAWDALWADVRATLAAVRQPPPREMAPPPRRVGS